MRARSRARVRVLVGPTRKEPLALLLLLLYREGMPKTTRTRTHHVCPAATGRNERQDPVGPGCVDRCQVVTQHAVSVRKQRGQDADVVMWGTQAGNRASVVAGSVEPHGTVEVAR